MNPSEQRTHRSRMDELEAYALALFEGMAIRLNDEKATRQTVVEDAIKECTHRAYLSDTAILEKVEAVAQRVDRWESMTFWPRIRWAVTGRVRQ